MGFDKLAVLLGGRPVVERSVRALAGSGLFGEVVLVTSVERWQEAGVWVERVVAETGVPVRWAPGGDERVDSVEAGLAALSPGAEWVAVHDGARPLVSGVDVRRVVEAAWQAGAAALAHPVVETVKRADGAGWVVESVDRAGLWAMETPQVFRVGVLRQAGAAARARGEVPTDDVSVVQGAGHPVQLVASTSCNLKITHPSDLSLAERLLATAGAEQAQG